MKKAFAEVERLIRENARHRKGFRLGEVSRCTPLVHARQELQELMDATTEREDLEETADLFGCLIHFCIKSGFSLKDVEGEILRKFRIRFPGAYKESE